MYTKNGDRDNLTSMWYRWACVCFNRIVKSERSILWPGYPGWWLQASRRFIMPGVWNHPFQLNRFSFFFSQAPCKLLLPVFIQLPSCPGPLWMAFPLGMRKKSISLPWSTGFVRSILLKYWVFVVWESTSYVELHIRSGWKGYHRLIYIDDR